MLIAPKVTYPGVYVVEVNSNNKIVPDIPTALTAFVGRTLMGPTNEPTEVGSIGDFQNLFGGVAEQYPLSFAVQDFFNNGGSQALIVRIYGSQKIVDAIDANLVAAGEKAAGGTPVNTAPPTVKKGAPAPTGIAMIGIGLDNVPKTLPKPRAWGVPTPPGKVTKKPVLVLQASNPGAWGNDLSISIDTQGLTSAAAKAAGVAQADLFNLTITYAPAAGSARTERITKVSVDPKAGRYRLNRVLERSSLLVRADEALLPKTADMAALIALAKKAPQRENLLDSAWPPSEGGNDGYMLGDPYFFSNSDFANTQEGIYALEKADIFNILVIPRDTPGTPNGVTYPDIFAYVARKRAFWVLEAPPGDWDMAITAGGDVDTLINQHFQNPGENGRYAAVFYPDVIMANPLLGGMPETFGPGGVVAGIMARTDAERGVWKAPAGTAATMMGVLNPTQKLNDDKNGRANVVGINCLRNFSATGTVVWGSRTLQGADAVDDPFKYVPVRRLANYIEESLYRAMQWAVFEPNAEPLWSAIRLQVTGFMTGLMVQGAFQGFSQKEAFFVKCDASTTTAIDIEKGICNVVVGYAPVKPAEFVVLYFEQMTATAA